MQLEAMQEKGNQRDWDAWHLLRDQLADSSTKFRVQWLQNRDQNTKYFHAVTSQRRRRNRIEELEKLNGELCEGESEIGQEISEYFQSLFTASDTSSGDSILGRTC